MRHCLVLLTLFTLAIFSSAASAQIFGRRHELNRINSGLHGHVIDFTDHHGKDRRIWSPALCEKRDMYVYLPPCYDPRKQYPLVIFLHGAGQDERFFLQSVAKEFDKAIVCGDLAPVIVAAPDGAIKSRPSYFGMATFFANTDAGRYEDYLMEDVWNFLFETFPIRPERDAHGLCGASMGGAAAFTLAIKHKDRIKIAIGIMPALNLRWMDCHGRYKGNFDPGCWSWRESVRHFEVIGRPRGMPQVRVFNLFGPLIGYGPDKISKLAQFNPVEVMMQYDLKPGELDLYVGYGGKDEFNIDAQVESFLHIAKDRNIPIGVEFDPNGRHDVQSGLRLFPGAVRWAVPLLEPYREPRR